MFRVLIFFVALSPALADAEALLVKKITNVYDGDTFRAEIANTSDTFSPIAVRVRGIDAPEVRGACESEKRAAIDSRESLKKKLYAAKKIELVNVGRDKYFRLLADVRADNLDLGSYQILGGHARRYTGGKRKGWCE
jgi:endonuclease YncB( thermonuclease family)